MHDDVKVVSRSAGILPDEPSLVRLLDGRLHVTGLVVELSTDVDVGWEEGGEGGGREERGGRVTWRQHAAIEMGRFLCIVLLRDKVSKIR